MRCVALRFAIENNEIKQIIQLQDTRKAKYNYAQIQLYFYLRVRVCVCVDSGQSETLLRLQK